MTVMFLKEVFDETLKHPNWFNGRVLTGTDLSEEQEAHLWRSRYVAQAIGTGVAYGLNIHGNGRLLTISAGLAISPGGDVLHLAGQAKINLVPQRQITEGTGSIFAPCDIGGTVTLSNLQSDYYVLALTTASQPSTELAPTSALDGNGNASCIHKYHEVGIQFKLIRLDQVFKADDRASASQTRNLLAHLCFGTPTLSDTAADPVRTPARYGLLHRLEELGELTDCDVPLAVIHFTGGAMEFVDMWAVRRPVFPAQQRNAYPLAISGVFSSINESLSQFSSMRRTVEGVAMLLQFQDHLVALQNEMKAPTVAARNTFQYLPAAGYLPIGGSRFRVGRFFSEVNYTEENTLLDPAYLREIFQRSYLVNPIDLTNENDAIEVYQVADADDDYRIFLRHQRVLVIEKPEEPQDDTRTGTLTISVVNDDGTPIDPKTVTGVLVIDQRGKQYAATYIATRTGNRLTYQEQALIDFAYRKARETYVKYGDVRIMEHGSAIPQKGFDEIVRVPELFLNNRWRVSQLPSGKYTARVTTTSPLEFGVSSSVNVASAGSAFVQVTVRRVGIKPPFDWGYKPDIRIPDGIVLDSWKYNPTWKDLLDGYRPEWDKAIDPGDWYVLDDPRGVLEAEMWLGQTPGLDPRVVTENPEIWLSKTYNPDTVSEEVDAIIRTADGSTFPLVVIAGDNALSQKTPLTRTDLPDYDAGTYAALDKANLGTLDTMASAPSSLVAAALGQGDTTYAASLIDSTRKTLRDDFQNGFMGLPGVSRDGSAALKESGFDTPVKLANASAGQIAGVLGVSSEYANRLLLNVRGSVPKESYALDAIGIGAGTAAKLAEANVETIGGLLTLANEDRTAVQDLLGTVEVEDLLDNGLLNIAKSEFDTSISKSVSTLSTMDRSLAGTLTELGIREAKELANSDPAELSAVTGTDEATLVTVIEEAKEYSNGFSTLVEGITGGAVTRDTVDEAGIGSSFGSISKTDSGMLETKLNIDTNTAIKLNNFSNIITGGSRFTMGGF